MAEVNGKDDNHKVESGEMKKIHQDDKSGSKSERQKTPYQKANFLSRMAFHWVQPIASKGKAGKLTEDDLMLAESEESNFCYDQFIKNWNKELNNEKHPSLYRAIRRTWIGQFMIAAVLKFCWSVLVLFASFYLVRSLVSFVQRANRGEDAPDYEGWTLACAFFVACFLFSVFLQQMTSKATRLGIRIRAAMSTAIYRKALRAENIAPDAGDVVSLVATDCNRLLEAAVDVHYLWSAPLEALAIVVLLIILTGYSAFIGLGLTLLVLGMQLVIGRAVTRLRSKSINVTDSRIHIMQEILLAIKLVKFYGWERR
jgi:ATP-binding cassette subfamily C (CFTR/MRP) protein 1